MLLLLYSVLKLLLYGYTTLLHPTPKSNEAHANTQVHHSRTRPLPSTTYTSFGAPSLRMNPTTILRLRRRRNNNNDNNYNVTTTNN